MDGGKIYDDDFLLWTEQQARALRELGGSNTLDIVHLAEEIEELGRRDLREAESLIELIYLHALKLVTDPDDLAARHWAGELVGFQSQLRRVLAPSMRQKLDLDQIWRDAIRRFQAGLGPGSADIGRLETSVPPFGLEGVGAPSFDVEQLLAAVRAAF